MIFNSFFKNLRKKLISFFYLIKIGTIKRKLTLIALRKLSNNKEEFNQVYKEKNVNLVQLEIPKEIIFLKADQKLEGNVKLIIKRNIWEGFFSNFTYVLLNMHIANLYNFDPIVDMESSETFYSEKLRINNSLNAWDYYFQQDVNLEYLKKHNKFFYSESFFSSNTFYKYVIENTSYMHFLFKKYINVRESILNDMNEFISREFCGSNIIGIHWRGTDIGRIKNEIYVDKFSKIVDPILKNTPNSKIFLCTEEKDYIKTFKKRYGNKVIYTNSFRTNSNVPPHLLNENPRELHRYNLGKEVMTDALLLSKSNILIGRRSNVFNSALIMGNISKERQIIIDGLGF